MTRKYRKKCMVCGCNNRPTWFAFGMINPERINYAYCYYHFKTWATPQNIGSRCVWKKINIEEQNG